MGTYKNPAIKKLAAQQVRYSPIEVRLEQMDKAENLLHELDPGKSYRYQDICERVTSYKSEMYPDLVIDGSEAVHDLRVFVEDLSDSANIPVERIAEPVLTVDEVSERFRVSPKTVDRWRNKGLVSRRFKFGNRKRVGFLKSSVDRFAKEHGDEIDRGGRFSQITDGEREEIVRRARRLARFGGNPTEISRRLSERTGRSPETIRYTIRNFDEQHPEMAVFPNASRPLTDDQRHEIYRKFRRNVPVSRLATDYRRTKTSVYRVVNEVRAEILLGQTIDFMDSPEFGKSNADRVILGPPPEVERKKGRLKAPPGLPPYLASLYEVPLLTREEEQYYFRKMNYLKFKAAKLQKAMPRSRPKVSDMDKLESLLGQATEIKNFLIRSNLRLVVSIAKRHIKPGSNFFEMVSDGNMSLIRAIEKFDYTKGNKFSTYATWAIMKNFARSIPAEHKILDRYRTGTDEVFSGSPEYRGSQFQEERTNVEQRMAIRSLLDRLDDRERAIIEHRFGLERGSEPETLEQVGQRFGVTKERIRQIEARALNKARKYAQEEQLEIPGI